MRTTGIILAGGSSSRFTDEAGYHKAFAKIDDKPLFIHIIERFNHTCDRILISVRDEKQGQEYHKYLLDNNQDFKTIEFVKDQKEFGDIHNFSDLGPMTGLLSALNRIDGGRVIVSCIDTPLIPHELDRILLDRLDNHVVAYPSSPTGPLFLNFAINTDMLPVKKIVDYLMVKQNHNLRLRPTDVILVCLNFVELQIGQGYELLININDVSDLKRARLISKLEVEKRTAEMSGAPVVERIVTINPGSDPNDLYQRLLTLGGLVDGILGEHIRRDIDKMVDYSKN